MRQLDIGPGKDSDDPVLWWFTCARQATDDISEFIDRLREAAPTVDWPPDTWDERLEGPTLRLGNLGKALRRSLSHLSPTELESLANEIEAALRPRFSNVQDPTELGVAVATGLLEALVGGTVDLSGLDEFLGPRTRAYLTSWDAFTGTRTPGLNPAAMPAVFSLDIHHAISNHSGSRSRW